ncbi:MAG: hypothetical protein SGPRY_013557, partial [Prymnesium sp.]
APGNRPLPLIGIPPPSSLGADTTAAYKSMNAPLRDRERKERCEKHRLAVTVDFLADAIKRLRAVDSLVRRVSFAWLPAPMSTTTDLKTAVEYGKSLNSVLLRLTTK